jgi:uncharacterized RDD family membrane protein YckC
MSSKEPKKDPKARDSALSTVESRDVLDSIFSEKGPMPAAKIGIRTLAFALDFILITAIASLVIWKIAMPQSHPGTFNELQTWSESLVKAYQDRPADGAFVIPEISNNLAEGIAYARDLQIIIFWLYFAIGEAFFKGSSLGKRSCRLRTVSTITLGTPPVFAGILRGGLKTITLFYPIALIATILARFFNKRQQLGHDMLSKTAVIDEKFVSNSTGKQSSRT